jgi:hypothetical protein
MTWDTVLVIDFVALLIVILLPIPVWFVAARLRQDAEPQRGRAVVGIAWGIGLLAVMLSLIGLPRIWRPPAPPGPETPPVYRLHFNKDGDVYSGTGFHVHEGRGSKAEQYLVTCFHVVRAALAEVDADGGGPVVLPPGTEQVPIYAENGSRREVFQVVAYDPAADVALLSPLKSTTLVEWERRWPPFRLAPKTTQLRAGERLESYGFPGSAQRVEFEDYSVREDAKDAASAVRLNGKAQRGQSGSPVLHSGEKGKLGDLVGILTAVEPKALDVGLPGGEGPLFTEVWICPVNRLHALLEAVKSR